MNVRRFLSRSEAETRRRGRDLARDLAPGTTLLLSGDLGAGKTAFVKGLAAGLGLDPADVTSPTFTLVHEYEGGRLPLVHVDLYRLQRADLDELGFDAEVAARGVLAIEWPERLVRAPAAAIAVRLEVDAEDVRSIEILS